MSKIMEVLLRLWPWIIKLGPRIIDILSDERYKEILERIVGLLTSWHPDARLRGQLLLTKVVAEKVAEDAGTPEEKELALDWLKRLNRLLMKMDIPVDGRAETKARRAAVRKDLRDLQDEMETYLGHTERSRGVQH